MRDIHKLCKICLNPGTRDIFDSGFTNIVSRDELNRIAEKLRFVTLLKVSPKENLPQQICDLCIVQLNVSYNFKRLALKNDFYIRQYMIENGMNLLKEDDSIENVETSLEIHQIHNVIRTNRSYRPPAISSIPNEPFRRNSTTSSVSGISTMIVNNGCDTNGQTANGNNQFAHPSRPFVQPIQIKTEPVDPDEETADINGTNPTNQSSPSSSSSGSVLTVNSSEKSRRTRPKTPPMIVINGQIENSPMTQKKLDSSSKTVTNLQEKEKEKAKDEKVKEKQQKNKENEEPKKTKNYPTRANKTEIKIKKTSTEKQRDNLRNLRTIKKPQNPADTKRKLREAAKKIIDKRKQQQKEAKMKKIKKAIQMKTLKKQQNVKNKNNNKKNSGQRKPIKVQQKTGKGKGYKK